jgi:DNA-damage-inducible protein J
MATDSIVRARIDAATKAAASAVLAGMGMSMSDAIRILLTKVAHENTFPFDLRPSAETIAAMEEARRGNLPAFATVADLMAELNRAED